MQTLVIGENPEYQLETFNIFLTQPSPPESFWDYYLIGGCFSGSIKLKPGRKGKLPYYHHSWSESDFYERIANNVTDQARVGDIEFIKCNKNNIIIKNSKIIIKNCIDFQQILSYLPKNTLITVFDCHG